MQLGNIISSIGFTLVYPVLFLVMRGSLRSRIAVVCESEVLMVMPRFSGGKWALPGGGIKQNELPSQAAVRELREELGIELRADNVQYLKTVEVSPGGISMRLAVFIIDVASKPATTRNHIELRDVGWFSIQEAGNLPMGKAEKLAFQQIESTYK